MPPPARGRTLLAMTTISHTTGGSAAAQGRLWGARAHDFTVQEPKVMALYESVLEELGIGASTRLLDVGCGPGLFLRLAAQRGATVSGIDAAAPFIEIARERAPRRGPDGRGDGVAAFR